MAKHRPSSKGARKGPPAAKMTRGRTRSRLPIFRPKPLKPDGLVLLLLGLALALRLWGIADRLPDPSYGSDVFNDSVVEETDRTTVGRAFAMWRGGLRPLDLNPHTGGWPALSFYFSLALQLLYRVVRFVSTGETTATAFYNGTQESPDQFFLFCRVASAFVGVLTVYVAYRVGVRLLARAGGLILGLFLAMNMLHVMTSQHVADPNLLALLFILLAAFPLLRLAERVTARDSVLAGAMIGLAGACKYVPLVLAAPFAWAHLRHALSRRGRGAGGAAGGGDRRARGSDAWAALAAGLLAMLAALFIATPYTFLDLGTTVQGFNAQRHALFSDWAGQTEFPISLPTYLASALPHAMGWPAYALAIAGLAVLLRKDRRGWMVAAIPAALVLASGILKAAQERYVLVALPFLLVGTVASLKWVESWWRAGAWWRGRAPSRAAALLAPALLMALAIGWLMPEFLATRKALSLPDSRRLSRRWIQESIDPKAPLGLELYGPVFREGERRYIIWPFFATQVPLVRPAFHAQFLDGLRYYVASGEISRRFEADSTHYPVETAYYRWLRTNAPAVWQSDPKRTSGPLIVVRRLPDSISTRAERDSLFRSLVPRPVGTTRLGLWCLDLSKLFLEQGENARAEEWARRGLSVGSKAMQPRLYVAFCEAMLRLGHPDSAETYARAAAVQYPDNYVYWVYRGMALEGMGRHEEAVSVLDAVPQSDPARAMARRNMGILYARYLGRPAEALIALKESIALDPGQEGADVVRTEIQRLESLR